MSAYAHAQLRCAESCSYSYEDLLALISGYIVTYIIVHGLLLGFAKRLIIPANSPNIGRWGLGLGRAIE